LANFRPESRRRWTSPSALRQKSRIRRIIFNGLLVEARDKTKKVAEGQTSTPTSVASLTRAVLAANWHKESRVYHRPEAGVASWYDVAGAIVEDGAGRGLWVDTLTNQLGCSLLGKGWTCTAFGCGISCWHNAPQYAFCVRLEG